MVLMPWPLDGAQEWFEGLLADVWGAPWNPSQWLNDVIRNWIDDVIRSNEAGAGWLHGQVWGWTSFLGNPLVTWLKTEIFGITDFGNWAFDNTVRFVTDVGTPLWNWLQDGIRATEQVGGWLHGDIFSWVASLGSPLWNWLQDNKRSIEDIAGWLHGELWTWIGGELGPLSLGLQGIDTAIELGFGWLRDQIPGLLGTGFTALKNLIFPELSGRLVEHSPPIWLYTLRPTGDVGLFEGIIGQGIKAGFDWILKGLTWIAEQIVGLMSSIAGAVSGVLTPILMEIVNTATDSVSEHSPDPILQGATDSLSQGLLKKIQSFIPTEKHSPPLLSELLVASAGVVSMSLLTSFGLSSVATYLDLAHPIKMTGIVSLAGNLLDSLNFPAMIGPILFSNVYAGIIIPIRYRWNELYTPMIPPLQDIITMVVREAFVEENIIKAPSQFVDNMKFHGFAEVWSDRYWTSHFLPIALRQAYENLWRGNWDKAQFMVALHISDIHPRWREDIFAVAFRPPTVRELGYGFDTGVYSVEDIIKYRRWGGLSPEDSEKAGLSMVAYRTEAEREALRREALADFVAGLDNESQLRLNLESVGGRPEAIELWVSRAKYRTERDLTLDLVKVSISDFIKGWDTEDELRQNLVDYGIVPERREVIIKDSIARRRRKNTETTTEKKKMMPVSRIRLARGLGLLGDEVFVTKMMDHNYTEKDARLELAIELTPRPITPEEIERRRDTIVSRRNKARRKWERSVQRVDSTITLLEGQIIDAETSQKESVDVISMQISAVDDELATRVPVGPPEVLEARIGRIERRYQILFSNIDEDLRSTAEAITDMEVIFGEAMDVFSSQVAVLNVRISQATGVQIPVLEAQRSVIVERRGESEARYLTRLRALNQDLEDLRDRRVLQEGLRTEELEEMQRMEILAIPPSREEDLLRRRGIMVQRREDLVTRWNTRITQLTRRRTEEITERGIIISQRDEELQEYDNELALLGGS